MLLLCVLAAILAAAGTVLLVWAIGYQRLGYVLTESSLRIENYDSLSSRDALAWHQRPPTTAPWTALGDPWLAVCASLGIVVLLVVMLVITSRFDSLPDQVPLRFDASSQPSQIAAKGDLLRLPLFGLICLA